MGRSMRNSLDREPEHDNDKAEEEEGGEGEGSESGINYIRRGGREELVQAELDWHEGRREESREVNTESSLKLNQSATILGLHNVSRFIRKR